MAVGRLGSESEGTQPRFLVRGRGGTRKGGDGRRRGSSSPTLLAVKLLARVVSEVAVHEPCVMEVGARNGFGIPGTENLKLKGKGIIEEANNVKGIRESGSR